ncbi:MAG: cysteine--tRNA ligase, partial [Bacteroidota bacterium]|nr:cysteine--tRNA ligase [Bacteroidota bacterium]
YTNNYHHDMELLNVLPPSIEPRASGHIIEQQAMVQKILDNGYAYISNGSVYFDVEKYNQKYHYGKLSGRVLDDLMEYTRELSGQEEKHNSYDFALWKKADPKHIMHWPSKWSEGFPGWHLECSVMSTKYLGNYFDIHGGGMDLLFPHHECEIAQTVAATGKESVKYWIHNNMITINGQKMGKSLGNFITLDELFSGNHKLLQQAYSPMTIRFFILQAHYRSTLDFSNEALQAAQKGMDRLFEAYHTLDKLSLSKVATVHPEELEQKCADAMNDDLNSPMVIAHLFDAVKTINSIYAGNESIDAAGLAKMKEIFNTYIFDLLGLKEEKAGSENNQLTSDLIELLLNLRMNAKAAKDFATSDKIRAELNRLGVEVKDKKDGFEWKIL